MRGPRREEVHGLTLPSSSFDGGASILVEECVQTTSSIVLRRRSSSEPDDKDVEEEENKKKIHDAELLSIKITQPIIPDSTFDDVTGDEFADPATVDRLARTGLFMATQPSNEWIKWKAHKDTEKILQEQKGKNNNLNLMTALDQGQVLVYIGTPKVEGYGSKLPLIKTKSILPLSAQEMAELLMDSERVKIYNKMSLGRKDLRIFDNCTKIVRNLTKPPVAKSQMVSVTLMHSRELTIEDQAMITDNDDDIVNHNKEGGYLVVSRAVPGMIEEELAELPRNDILLGVNLLQDLGPNECLMTAVTHVYSPVLPTMLARGMGVSSAINFIKDIRKVCKPVAAN
jgi:hypothetical protein